MKPKAQNEKAARARTPTIVYSTSEARANFAEALDATRVDSVVIGLERYGRILAAIAPLEAVYMLAGKADQISPDVRRRIERNAQRFVQDVQHVTSRRVAEEAVSAATATGANPKSKRLRKRS